jgi:tripartite ATP-independent transporter DctP family solute receptor
MFKRFVTTSILAASLAAGSVFAADKIVLRTCNTQPASHPWNVAIGKLNEIIKKNSNGRIEIAQAYSSSLGTEPELVESVRAGTLGFVVADPTVGTTFCKELELTSLPFLFRDTNHWKAVLDGPVGKKYAELIEQKCGLRVMAYWGGIPREVLSVKKQVKSLDDLRNFKMRLAASELKFKVWQALGALPISVAYPEIYSALVSGLVDGMENEMTSLVASKFYEPAKNMTMLAHEITVRPLFMNPKWLDGLPPGDKAAIEKSIAEATPIARQLEQDGSNSALADLRDKFKVNVFEIDKTPFYEKLAPVYKEYGESTGMTQTINDIQAVK